MRIGLLTAPAVVVSAVWLRLLLGPAIGPVAIVGPLNEECDAILGLLMVDMMLEPDVVVVLLLLVPAITSSEAVSSELP